MPSPEDRAFQNRIAEMARRENALRDEQWRIQQRQEGHAKCLSTPRACGIGIFNAGQRMAAWDRTGGKVIQQPYTKRYRAFQAREDSFSHHTREVRPHRSEKHGWDDSTKTKKEMEIMLFGKEKWDREQRSAKISGELKTLKTDHEKMLKAENARKVAKLKREHEKHRATIAANIKKAKRKANHPQNPTIRSPARRHKTGARSRYVPPPRGRSRR